MPARLCPTPTPIAPFSSCTHKAITARSKRGSAIPGIARSNLPDRKLGWSTPARQWAAAARRARPLRQAQARLEAAVRRSYLPLDRREGELPMTIQAGDRLPDVPLAIATPDGPQPTTSGEF